MSPEKQPISFRLSDDAADIIRTMSKHMGISQASYVEMAVREKAMRQGKEVFEVLKKWVDGLSPEMKAKLQKRIENS